MLGEHPPLPPSLIRELHRQHYWRTHARQRLEDWVWSKAADGAVAIFEQYRRLHN